MKTSTLIFSVIMLSGVMCEISDDDLCSRETKTNSSYYAKNITSQNCGCTSCIRRCCKPGFVYKQQYCHWNESEHLRLPVYTNVSLAKIVDSIENFIVGFPNCSSVFRLNANEKQKFYVQLDGSVFVPQYDKTDTRGNDRYCVDGSEGFTPFLCFTKKVKPELTRIRILGYVPFCNGRQEHGEYHHLFLELKKDKERFHSYMSMSNDTFGYIFDKVEPLLDVRKYTNLHSNPILAEERLVVTIRYLATESSYRSLSFSFGMSVSTVSKIVAEVCEILWTAVQRIHMRATTTSDFVNIAEKFERLWGVPNCIGALDSKHVRIKCPAYSGCMYYNYKSYFSIVLQALVDCHYRFISIDVGGYGKQSDGRTFSAPSLLTLLKQNALGIPTSKILPNSEYILPYVIIADEAYPLKQNLLKPYSGHSLTPTEENFNKRLSRARKCVECAFGIIFFKWRILSEANETSESTADCVINAICILQNTIIDKEGHHSISRTSHQYQVVSYNEIEETIHQQGKQRTLEIRLQNT